MSQKVIYFSAIILIIFKFSHQLYFDPNLTNPLIPPKWQQMCGRRYYGRKLDFAEQCFGREYKDQIFPFYSSFKGLEPMSRVVGGRDVTYHESPWTVQIASRICRKSGKGKHCPAFGPHCTGVLLTMRHVLTAAHCDVANLEYKVFAGNDQWLHSSKTVWTTESMSFVRHPKYIQRQPNGEYEKDFQYDIAIITFTEPINWEEYGRNKETGQFIINTICLPKKYHFSSSKTSLRDPQKAVLYGWGWTGENTRPTILQRGDFSVERKVAYFNIYPDGNSQRTCGGDSGSGLVQYLDDEETRAVLIGINSHKDTEWWHSPTDMECKQGDPRQGYAVAVVRHLDWIDEHLKD